MKIRMVKIGDVARVMNGFAFKSSKYMKTGYRVIRITNVQKGFIVDDNPKFVDLDDNKLSKFILEANDILISLTGNVGRVGVIRKHNLPAVLNQRVGKLVVTSSDILPEYLFSILNSDTFEQKAINKSKGIAQKNIGANEIEEIEIPLPPLEEQKCIVRELDAADALRQKRKQAIVLLDDYLKSVFLEMFGDPVENPKGWEKQKFSKLGTLDRGKSKHRPRNAPELLGGEYPLIQTGDVANSGIYIDKYTSTYSYIGLKQSKQWPKGTLCITIAANIAKTGILDFDACFPDSVVGFVADKEKTNNEFVHFWISFLQEILERNAPESAQKNINLRILRDLDVIVPPVALQNKFGDVVIKSESVKQRMTHQTKKFDVQFQVLMQQFFSA